tara:strand:- start:355 stop:729 length:375 start_codon:yes stop_codon:yes gene_type:complete
MNINNTKGELMDIKKTNVYLTNEQYVDMMARLQEAIDLLSVVRNVEYKTMELAWTLSNADIAPYTGGVKDIVEFANDFDPTMQNGKIVASDIYDDDEQMTPEEVAQLDKDTISNDAYSRWEHLT